MIELLCSGRTRAIYEARKIAKDEDELTVVKVQCTHVKNGNQCSLWGVAINDGNGKVSPLGSEGKCVKITERGK